MSQPIKLQINFQQLKIAVLIAIIIGVAISVFFMVIEKDSYSVIYIIPDSIKYNSDDNIVLYTYGVKSSEAETMDYNIDTYLDDKLMKTKQFILNKGEILDETERINLPSDTKYPSKISLRLTTNKATEEVHFWIRKQ
jgi:hypothetical protein